MGLFDSIGSIVSGIGDAVTAPLKWQGDILDWTGQQIGVNEVSNVGRTVADVLKDQRVKQLAGAATLAAAGAAAFPYAASYFGGTAAAPTSLWGATGTAPFAVNAALAPGAAASAGGSGLLSTLGALSLAKQGLGMLGGGVPQSQVPNYNIASVPMSQYKGYTPTNFMSNAGSPSGSTPTQVAMMTPTEKETLLQAVLKSKPKEFAKYIG